MALENDERLKELLRDTLKQKDVIKWGYVRTFGGPNAASCDSVAAHIAAVSTLATILGYEYSEEIEVKTGIKLDLAKLTLLGLVHDLGECRSGDTGATGHAVHGTCNLFSLEREGLAKITDGLIIEKIALELFDDYRAYRTPEAIFLHVADNIEGFEKGMSISFGRGESAKFAEDVVLENVEIYNNKKEMFPQMSGFIDFCVNEILQRSIDVVRKAYR